MKLTGRVLCGHTGTQTVLSGGLSLFRGAIPRPWSLIASNHGVCHFAAFQAPSREACGEESED